MTLPGRPARVWIDGREEAVADAALGVADGGLLGGSGLFETLALRAGRVIDLEPHLARMAGSAAALGLDPPPLERMGAVALSAAATPLAAGCGWLKIVWTAGRRFVALCGEMDPELEGRPVTAVVLRWRRNPADPLVGHKTLSYAANLVGLREARSRGAEEGLWLNVRGRLAEGCTSNVFVVNGRRLSTPGPREGILPGVTRARVIEAARRLGLQVEEGRVPVKRLLRSGEAFLTSSLRGIRPLLRVDRHELGRAAPGPVAGRVRGELQRMRGLSAAGTPALDSPARDGEV